MKKPLSKLPKLERDAIKLGDHLMQAERHFEAALLFGTIAKCTFGLMPRRTIGDVMTIVKFLVDPRGRCDFE
jgi:hypothetical protein